MTPEERAAVLRDADDLTVEELEMDVALIERRVAEQVSGAAGTSWVNCRTHNPNGERKMATASVFTQEQRGIVEKCVAALCAEGRVGSVGRVTRVFRIRNGADSDIEVRSTDRLAAILQAQYPELRGLKVSSIGNKIGKALQDRLGVLRQSHRAVAKDKRTGIAALARAELQRRLAKMSVQELAAIAKG